MTSKEDSAPSSPPQKLETPDITSSNSSRFLPVRNVMESKIDEGEATTEEPPPQTAHNGDSLSSPTRHRGSRASSTGSSSSGRKDTTAEEDKLRMSTVSNFYDLAQKGYLDPTEQELRRMDSQNRGFLDNRKVYGIMTSLQQEQQKSAQLIERLQKEQQTAMSLKRAIIYMSAFAFVLALSNIGTSFAAARLAKDITVNSHDLVAKGSDTRVGTTSKTVVLQLEAMDMDPSSSNADPTQRRLHQRFLQGATELACGPSSVQDYTVDNPDGWDMTDTSNITGVETGTANSTVQCNAVGRITYNHAVQLYQQFCPNFPFQDDTLTTPVGCDLGLAELLLVCGSRKTRILGGEAFPLGGIPDYESSGSYFTFPSPERTVPEGESMSLYFSALQLVQEPPPGVSLTANPPPVLCEERFHFKLYCDPSGGFGCIMFAVLWQNQKQCQGRLQMCQTNTPAISRRRGLRMTTTTTTSAAAATTPQWWRGNEYNH